MSGCCTVSDFTHHFSFSVPTRTVKTFLSYVFNIPSVPITSSNRSVTDCHFFFAIKCNDGKQNLKGNKEKENTKLLKITTLINIQKVKLTFNKLNNVKRREKLSVILQNITRKR